MTCETNVLVGQVFLMVETWRFSGAWELEFGVYLFRNFATASVRVRTWSFS